MGGGIVRRSKPETTLTDHQREIVRFIGLNQPVNANQIAERFGIAKATAKTHLNRLMHAGFVVSNGPGRHAGWTLGDANWSASREVVEQAARQCPSVWAYADRLAAC